MGNQSWFDGGTMDKLNIFFGFEEFEGNKPFLKTLSQSTQYGLLAVMLVSFIVGSYFKHVYYGQIRQTTPSFKERPINLMLLCGSVIQHIKHISLAINYTLTLGFNLMVGELLGGTYCQISLIITVFGTCHLVFSSLSIAIFRLLYLKCDTWLKYRAGELRTSTVLFSASLLFSAFFTFLFLVEESSHRLQYNICMGRSEVFWDIMYRNRNPLGR